MRFRIKYVSMIWDCLSFYISFDILWETHVFSILTFFFLFKMTENIQLLLTDLLNPNACSSFVCLTVVFLFAKIRSHSHTHNLSLFQCIPYKMFKRVFLFMLSNYFASQIIDTLLQNKWKTLWFENYLHLHYCIHCTFACKI